MSGRLRSDRQRSTSTLRPALVSGDRNRFFRTPVEDVVTLPAPRRVGLGVALEGVDEKRHSFPNSYLVLWSMTSGRAVESVGTVLLEACDEERASGDGVRSEEQPNGRRNETVEPDAATSC
jgi:hypothetical protein